MKNIVFVLTGVGGTQGLEKVRKEIEVNYNDKVNLKIFALNKIVQEYIKSSTLIDLKTLFGYIKDNKPDMVINETSNFAHIQNKVTDFLNKENIYNISFLDTGGNYNNRFEKIPNKIIAPSNIIKEEILENVPIKSSNIHCLGNPAFNLKIKEITSTVLINKKNKVLFISQPLKELGKTPSQFYYLNYFKKYLKEKGIDFELNIKLHPNSNIKVWDKKYHHLILNNENFKFEDYYGYNLLVGRDSTVMLKTAQLNIPTIFYNKSKEGYQDVLNNKIKHNAPYLLSTHNSDKKIIDFLLNILNKKETL